jgi:hypothetical protein
MAFTPAEKHNIAHILGTTVTLLNAHITSLGATLDADAETAVRLELTRWAANGFSFFSVEPKERNFGARINSTTAQNDIRRNVALSLEWPFTMVVGMGTLQIGI